MKVRIHEPKHDAGTSGGIKKSCSDWGSLCSLLYIFITAGCPTQKWRLQRLFKGTYCLLHQCSTKYNAYKKFLYHTRRNGVTFYLNFNFNPERYVNHKSPKIIINSLSACALQQSAQKVAQLWLAWQKKMFKTCNSSSFNSLKAYILSETWFTTSWGLSRERNESWNTLNTSSTASNTHDLLFWSSVWRTGNEFSVLTLYRRSADRFI